MKIRPAKRDDASQIADLLNPPIRDTTITFTTQEKTVADIVERLDNETVLVLEQDGAILGTASQSMFRSGPGYADAKEISIYISPDRAHRGLGQLLLSELEKQGLSSGVRHFVAGVSGENQPAMDFFQRQGYVRVGFMPSIGQKFGRRLDLVLFQKDLAKRPHGKTI